MGNWMKNLEVHIPETLAAGVRVMVYAGDLDFICNWEGNHQWTEQMQWAGQDAFNAAAFENFPKVAGQAAGQRKASGGLSFVRIYKAGHMVPMDQPWGPAQDGSELGLRRMTCGASMSRVY